MMTTEGTSKPYDDMTEEERKQHDKLAKAKEDAEQAG
jgi:hypothetical protein